LITIYRKENMEIVGKMVLIVAIGWAIWQIYRVRIQVRNREIIAPPIVAATFVFALFIVIIMISGASPFHLVWLFLLSFVLGIILLSFPFGVKLIMGFLTMLANVEHHHEQKKNTSLGEM